LWHKAIAYALYGREQEAVRSLGAVDWNRKAPLIQAIGLSAESVVELLCRREPVRAVELARKARAMSSVNGAIPGSAQSQRYHDTCVAVGEALSNIEAPTGIRVLEESSSSV